MNKAALSILMIGTLLFTQGCSNRMWDKGENPIADTFNSVFDTAPTTRSYLDTREIPIIKLNRRAADVLNSNLERSELNSESAIYVKPFTNQKNPNDNSIFGSVMIQQVAARLVQRGRHITEGEPGATEILYTDGTTSADYQNSGSLKGSQKELPPRAGLLTGSYVVGENYIYMSAKIIRLVDSIVVSANDWVLPLSDNIRQMLLPSQGQEGLTPTVKTSFD